jgi:hypothetical protein
MAKRHFPVLPNLDQLKHQAKDLLRDYRAGDADALADFAEFHLKPIERASAKLADAQFVLARSYGLPSWPRLVTACRMTNAIWHGDIETVRALVLRDPSLITEDTRGVKGNWGPPLSYAANLGQDAIIEMLRNLGAGELQHAFNRACLQGKVKTARMLHRMMGAPAPTDGCLEDPAYTLNVAGTELLLELGARVYDNAGKPLAAAAMVIQTDSRNPAARHRILELYAEHGFRLPDTPTMAVLRGRIDLLAEHLRRDPSLLERTFSFQEIYPPELGCNAEAPATEAMATYGSPLGGATLLHLAADYDELEVARWLLDQGMDVDARAALDSDSFGGHTALFASVVSQPNFWLNHNLEHHRHGLQAPFTRLLLDRGADPNIRASLRKELHPGYERPGLYEYRNVTPLEWGEQFHFKKLINETALEMIRERMSQAAS